jgi:hypothetical protein
MNQLKTQLAQFPLKDGDVVYEHQYYPGHHYCVRPYEESQKMKLVLSICVADHATLKQIHYLRKLFLRL